MKISILQQNIVWGDPAANRAAADVALAACEPSALYVLPEMWATGFATQPENVAEDVGTSASLTWMVRRAAEYDAAIAGSLAVREGGRFYNRFYFVKPSGEVVFYNKRHLFRYGHEDAAYTAGTERVVVAFRGVRILLQVCYDLRFPVFSRNRADYDLALYVANWPQSRQQAWDTLVRARAIENQCYVAAVNRVGDDPACHYAGGSAVVHPYGDAMQVCPFDKPAVLSAEIDMEALRTFRQKFPVLEDGDGFVVE